MTTYSVGMADPCHNSPPMSRDLHSVFAFPAELWYGSGMLQAYVGIVSLSGIEKFKDTHRKGQKRKRGRS